MECLLSITPHPRSQCSLCPPLNGSLPSMFRRACRLSKSVGADLEVVTSFCGLGWVRLVLAPSLGGFFTWPLSGSPTVFGGASQPWLLTASEAYCRCNLDIIHLPVHGISACSKGSFHLHDQTSIFGKPIFIIRMLGSNITFSINQASSQTSEALNPCRCCTDACCMCI